MNSQKNLSLGKFIFWEFVKNWKSEEEGDKRKEKKENKYNDNKKMFFWLYIRAKLLVLKLLKGEEILAIITIK